jgi:FtsH-binding integral membrane protein
MTTTTLSYPSASEINSAMGRVYTHMMLAVLTSMIVSGLIASSPAVLAFFFTGFMKWIVIFAPLAAIFAITFALASDPPRSVAVAMLHGFAALMGISMAAIFAVFTTASVTTAFMGAVVLFGVLSAYGYFTKQSLDSWGKYLLVAVIALIITSIINVFLGSSLLQMIVSAVGVVVFLGLTAYDTQKIREQLMEGSASPSVEVQGALTLYLDFINLFISLAQLLGVKKE